MAIKKNQRYYYSLNNFSISARSTIDGRWKLVRRIGTGGNGEVWQCRDVNDGQEYAIKFLKRAYKEPYSRFYDEERFMEDFGDVPGIMPIIAKYIPPVENRYADKTKPFYYVMPLAKAIHHDIYAEPVENKIRIIRALLEMLVNLHEQGIAHRDIKPANILLYNGQYVLSDFGLVYFQGKSSKTPPNTALGAKWTRSPQMERDAIAADKFKADVYSMAKTIWMIFTGDFTSFEGQYDPSSPFLSLRKYVEGKYLTPLENLLARCTDHEEGRRPTARELLDAFNDWDAINHNWDRENLLQWIEIQRRIFPIYEPDRAEWTGLERIVGILNLLGSYQSLNHMFFPNGGGLDLTGATLAREEGFVELHCRDLIYTLRPRRLLFERISDDFQWNHFRLEAEEVKLISEDFQTDDYMEEFGELTEENGNCKLIQLHEFDNLSKEEVEKYNARHISRFLKGSMVIFHKNSLYNLLISNYKREHDIVGAEQFRKLITDYSLKLQGKTIADFRKQKAVETATE